jgi:tetratricopeptide (TPR) repeat protein
MKYNNLNVVQSLIRAKDPSGTYSSPLSALENRRVNLALAGEARSAPPEITEPPRQASLARESDLSGELANRQYALTIARNLARAEPDNPERQRELANILTEIGDFLVQQRQPVKAIQYHRESFEIRETLMKADPNNAELQSDLSIGHERMGNALMELGDRDAALTSSWKSLKIECKLVKRDPKNVVWRRNLANIHGKVGIAAILTGRIEEGRSHLDTALEMWRELDAIGLLQPMDASRPAELECLLQRLPRRTTTSSNAAWLSRILDWARRHR